MLDGSLLQMLEAASAASGNKPIMPTIPKTILNFDMTTLTKLNETCCSEPAIPKHPNPERPTPAFSAPRHPTKPENTKALRGAGALERMVRR